ncbi:hypothetical protein GDO81_025779 [Engystomops pustulosus]|uniref:Uncharacterized protein n=1 Tax=Engystomops pustulosus TaxID=76066 RepID=A0AAV6YPL5_ENGPU|nr:hypothetical protein GDO81_025779 [Engystomops pustulosus]
MALSLHSDPFAEVGGSPVKPLSQRVVRHALAIMHLLITEVSAYGVTSDPCPHFCIRIVSRIIQNFSLQRTRDESDPNECKGQGSGIMEGLVPDRDMTSPNSAHAPQG